MKITKTAAFWIIALAAGIAFAAPGEDYTELFPPPLTGWTAEPASTAVVDKGTPVPGTSVILERRYRNPRTKCQILIRILSRDIVLSALVEQAYLDGPDKLNSDFRPYSFAGLRGVETGPPGQPDFVALELRSARMVSIKRDCGTVADIQRYLATIDFKAIDRWKPAQRSHIPLPPIDLND